MISDEQILSETISVKYFLSILPSLPPDSQLLVMKLSPTVSRVQMANEVLAYTTNTMIQLSSHPFIYSFMIH